MAAIVRLSQTRSMHTESHSERPAGPPPGQGFFDWLRGLDITRGSDRWFAGVAGGVAQRLKIDPIIVRGVFVVLALLGGPGILLYLLGWLLLPDVSGRIHVEEIVRGRAQTGVIVTAVVVTAVVIIPAIFSSFIPGASFPAFSVWNWDVWGVLGLPGWLTATIATLCWIAVIVLGCFWLRRVLLQRGREAARAASEAGETGAPDQPPFTDDTRSFADRAETFATRAAEGAERAGRDAADWGRRAGEAADQWGRDVGKQADAWSARYADHHDAHRLGTAHVVITLALSLVAAGITALWTNSLSAPLPLDSVAPDALVTALIAALAVLAVSLIIAGVRGRHTGWVGFLAFCGVVALLFTVVLPWGARFQPFGNTHVDTAEVGAVIVAGNATVDLAGIEDRAAGLDDLEVWLLAGSTTIELPDKTPTIVHVRMLAGRIDESGRTGAGTSADTQRTVSGPFLFREIRSNVTPANASSASVVTVTVGAGSVEVEGGGTASSARKTVELETTR